MAEPTKPQDKKDAPRKERIVAVHGELRHLFTNVVFTADSKLVEWDNFIEVQVEAGKLAVAAE